VLNQKPFFIFTVIHNRKGQYFKTRYYSYTQRWPQAEINYRFGNFFIKFASNNCDVRVIAKRTLRDFWEKHSDCEEQLKSWYRETEKSEWSNINELKSEYPSASILKDNRIVYNIKGNNYRLIVKFNFEFQICWIRFIGTHAEYDKIDANSI
jgi:mRNA interferase HigB